MSPPADANSDEAPLTANEVVLTPKISSKWALTPAQSLVIAIWCVVFLLLNYLPLRSPILWSDLMVGDWILEHRALPQQDPFVPLAEGMRVLHSRWLTHVVLAAVAWWGEDWLQVLFGVATLLTFGLLTRAYTLRCNDTGVAAATGILVLLLAWTRYTQFLPEHLAGTCLAVLLWLIAPSSRSGAHSRRSAIPWRDFIGIPLLFVVWANLHSSFLWGLVLLACLFLGELLSGLARQGSLGSTLADPRVRQALYRVELGLVASLLNPVGIDLALQLLWFAHLDNLRELVEWQPLSPLNRDGWGFAISVLLMLVTFRRSRVPVGASAAVLLLVFSTAALLQRRFIAWYAPVFGFVMVPHFADVWLQYRATRQTRSQPADASTGEEDAAAVAPWSYTLVSALLVWLAFSLTGISRPLLGGKPRSPQQLYGPGAPLELIEFLHERPPAGLVVMPFGWSDFLLRHGPAGLQPFVSARLEVVPRYVWRDYQRATEGQSGWQRTLAKYDVQMIIADKDQQRIFVGMARSDPDWEVVYEDEPSIVFTTKRQRGGG